MTKQIIEINENICKNTKFYKRNIYVINGQICVKNGVKLTVEDGTEIFIKNGIFKDVFNIDFIRSKLIFESGSILKADKVYFKACDAKNSVAKIAENGGIYFVGTLLSAEKDSITTDQYAQASCFKANLISTSYLGSADLIAGAENIEYLSNIDDYDAISVLGVNKNEWKIKKIYSEYSGDDGFDVQNSIITVKSIKILKPEEDGLNIVSSTITITDKLEINMGITNKTDRDIFDLENDTKYSVIILVNKCKVNINGIFGDQLLLLSADLPSLNSNSNTKYKFNGQLTHGDTLIYTIDYLLF
jgi:hypothetical protein